MKSVRAFVLFMLGWVPATVVCFLYLSGFFQSWTGHAVSVRPVEEDAVMARVLIVDETGDAFEDWWPLEMLEGIDLPFDRLAIPPSTVPEGSPRTQKALYTMSYTIEPADGGSRVVSTATPTTLGLSLVILLLGVALRNMLYAGNPFSLEPRGVELVKAQRAPGSTGTQGSKPSRRSTSKKGPPPPKRRRGSGRRK